MGPARRRTAPDLAAALVTVVVHVAPLERWIPEVVEIVVLASCWLGYLGHRARADPDFARACGLAPSARELRESAPLALAVAAVGIVIMALVAALRERPLGLPPSFAIELLLYPLWGLAQQWILVAVLLVPLDARVPRAMAVLCTSLVFGLVHAPDLATALATTILGLAAYPLFFRARSLYTLALLHGVLGAFHYHWVLGVDPLAAVL